MRLAAALCLAALGSCTKEFYDPMERQPKYKAYSESAFYPDNRAMRQPPAGAVPREQLLGSRELTAGLDLAGKPARAIPLPVTREFLEEGRHGFNIYCATCHGLLADGNSIVARNMNLRVPPNLLTDFMQQKSPGELYRVIAEGYGLMASYSAELNTRERWAVVAYLRARQLSQAAPLDRAPPDERERLERERKGGAK